MTMFVIWIGLLIYAFFLAPGESILEDEQFHLLLRGQFEQVDPLILMIFSFLGLYPFLFAFLILPQDDNKLRALPFVFLSFFLGAFALLPYFVYQGLKTEKTTRTPNRLFTVKTSRIIIIVLLILVIFLYGFGLFTGSFSAYQQAFFSSQFISIMTVDFFVLTWLSYHVFNHKYHHPRNALALLPLIGFLILLASMPNQQKREGE
ncbi:hypothetical protein [Metabacillus iocasae]|uniref:Membrane protein n=1 Tax=Priestia iocasae TaxID=2291674 RepID=A0ABS2QWV1_9BACI|nr:hypothetical protein [Metabacillus iocasae]MBM7703437.1 putative membrane protein [Metabacillus iocasae]